MDSPACMRHTPDVHLETVAGTSRPFTSRRVSIIDFLRRTPSAGLLLTQLVGVLLYPWMESSPQGQAIFTVFSVFVLSIALQIVRRSPWLTWLATLLVVVVVVLSIASAIAPRPGLTAVTAAME